MIIIFSGTRFSWLGTDLPLVQEKQKILFYDQLAIDMNWAYTACCYFKWHGANQQG